VLDLGWCVPFGTTPAGPLLSEPAGVVPGFPGRAWVGLCSRRAGPAFGRACAAPGWACAGRAARAPAAPHPRRVAPCLRGPRRVGPSRAGRGCAAPARAAL